MLECVSVHIIIYPKYNCAFAGGASLFAMQLSLIRNIGICFPPLFDLFWFGKKREKDMLFKSYVVNPLKLGPKRIPKSTE
jgi:hypothetical protein